MFLPPSIAFVGLVAALCAMVLGARRLAFVFAAPALWRWVIVPVLVQLFSSVPFWVDILLAIVAVVAMPFLAISALQRFTNFGYGEHAAGKVAAHYLIHLYDAIGRALVAILVLPFSLLRRLRKR